MKEIELEKAVEVLNGKYLGNKSLKGISLSGVSVDSRTIKEGELFFAIKGENFDGYDFAGEAIKKSGIPAVADKKVGERATILVEDVIGSLGDLASYYKKAADVFVIAVTGSYGKTTTKDFIGSIFSRKYSTLVSFKNYNNLIGVPLNLFRLENEKIAILEFGTNQFGEIKRLSEIVEPDIALITGIGSAHLQAFGDRNGVLKEKSDIAVGLKGPLFVNGDDPFLRNIKGKKIIKVGFSKDNDFAFNILQESIDGTIFSTSNSSFWIKLPTVGMLRCAMFAVSVALHYGISPRDIQEGLIKVENVPHRMEIKRTEMFNIIDDTYNSNPDSLLNAVSFLSLMPGRKIMVLGPMLELGENSLSIHRELGKKLKYRINELIAVGREAGGFVEGFGGGYSVAGKEEALEKLHEILRRGDTILFKSSRGFH
ncbi:MAG: UDP-N-acetylmuramoyl-tripeptide--D-alanyl-D-alanine ligase [candidate division WOR-3 bacterium]